MSETAPNEQKEINLSAAVEAILFASGASVEVSRIAQALEISDERAEELITALKHDYDEAQRGITIIKLKNSYQLVSRKEYAPQIRTVLFAEVT